MTRTARLKLLKALEEKRGSKIIVYFTGDRRPIGSRIAEDAVRPLYEHLLSFGSSQIPKVELFIYSRGGDVSVPWRIVSMIREFTSEFNVLIPYKSHSCATLLSLGADNIVMGRKAELSPIDPMLIKTKGGDSTVPPQEIPVEDVEAFVSFIKDKATIKDQMALANVVSHLIKDIGSLTLGSITRQYSHIRLVARKLINSRKDKFDEERVNTIIETLTQKIYSHGHAIGRKEAHEIGLPVEYPRPEVEELMWKLYLQYETLLKLQDPFLPEFEIGDEDYRMIPDQPLAVIESENKLHIFNTAIEIRRKRNIPSSPQININLNIPLPPGVDPRKVPPSTQQIMQHIMREVGKIIPQLVHKELARQSPVVAVEFRNLGGKWIEEI